MRYVVLYEPAPDVLERAPQHRDAHREWIAEFAAAGTLVGIGPFGDPVGQGSMGIFTTRDAAEAFAEGDPFVTEGVVARYEVRDWNDILAPES